MECGVRCCCRLDLMLRESNAKAETFPVLSATADWMIPLSCLLRGTVPTLRWRDHCSELLLGVNLTLVLALVWIH